MFDDVLRLPIVMGSDGLWGIRNADRVRLGGLKVMRNATLEDNTVRTAGGASKLGSSFGARGLRAIDYWPDPSTQRTVVMGDDGKIWKDNGSGGGWATVHTGLTVSGAVPCFTRAGSEELGRSRQLFYADGLNQERVLVGDAAAVAALSAPPPEWTGSNRPRAFVNHANYNWGFGNLNTPHLLFRSLSTNHQDFTTTRYAVPIFSGDGDYLSGGISFKGNLILWKHPAGVWAFDTTDPTPANWFPRKIGSAGMAGPNCFCIMENDILYVDPFGGLHMISAVQEFGNVKSSDLSVRKLGQFIPEHINRAQLAMADLVYYGDKRKAVLACAATGQTSKTLRLSMEVANFAEVGERWEFEDRDINDALFTREKDDVLILAMVDNAGQVWNLDQPARNKDGAGYTFEWWTHDTDFRQIAPQLQGRIINLWFLQVIYDPRIQVAHDIGVYIDGVLTQTVSPTLTGRGAVLPLVLPFVLGGESISVTPPQRLKGHGYRVSFRGLSTAANADISIAGLIVGVSSGE